MATLSSSTVQYFKKPVYKECGVLLGTTRQKIIDLSPIKTQLIKSGIKDLIEAEEVFITNVAYGITFQFYLFLNDKVGYKRFSSINEG